MAERIKGEGEGNRQTEFSEVEVALEEAYQWMQRYFQELKEHYGSELELRQNLRSRKFGTVDDYHYGTFFNLLGEPHDIHILTPPGNSQTAIYINAGWRYEERPVVFLSIGARRLKIREIVQITRANTFFESGLIDDRLLSQICSLNFYYNKEGKLSRWRATIAFEYYPEFFTAKFLSSGRKSIIQNPIGGMIENPILPDSLNIGQMIRNIIAQQPAFQKK